MHIYHIYPMDDWIEHDTDGDSGTCNCVCCPRVEPLGLIECSGDVQLIGVMIVHRQVREDYVEPPRWRRLWCWFRSFFKRGASHER